ncbi:MAG: AraC family transcriptional regulator [Eubacterium sp.]|nr:AraC family transcriptional regulator [Eubacterium sp.]
MKIYDFKVDKPFSFNWTGKFEAPDENWIHMTRELLDFELIIMTEGTLYIAADDRKYTVNSGEYVLLCPPCHQYGLRPSKCSFYWIHFTYNEYRNNPVCHDDTEIHGPLPAEETRILLPETARVPRLDRMIVLLKQLQDSDRKYRNVNQNAFTLTGILCELYSQLYLSGGRITMKGEKVQLYTDITDYISWRIRENIRVSEIAAYFGYNEKYITTFFKKASGSSLKSYILNQKMELAKAMLTDTNTPIAQIGYDIGFSDNHNFSSAFKKVTSQSPSEYRNTYAERQMFHQ